MILTMPIWNPVSEYQPRNEGSLQQEMPERYSLIRPTNIETLKEQLPPVRQPILLS
jgi:hypothetical protein